MSAQDEDRIKNLLRQALPPVEAAPEPARDLWPAIVRQLDVHPAIQRRSRWIWFDWALAAGLAVVAASFPMSIPLLIYYL